MSRVLLSLLGTVGLIGLGEVQRLRPHAEIRESRPVLEVQQLPPLTEIQERPPLTDRYDFSERSMVRDLPGRLAEISGLAFTPDGHLFAHDDERAWIHEIEPETGDVGKRFMLGESTVREDFEGIAIAGDRFFLITSGGWLYEAREGEDREEVVYRVTDTGLGSACEVEGLEYHPGWDELLIACKTTRRADAIVIHRMPMSPDVPRPPPILVDRAALPFHGIDEDFHPSGLALDPTTGTLILVSGPEESILEVSLEGRVLSGRKLSRRRHRQTEGVAIGPDGTLYLSDEGAGRDARLTAYSRIEGLVSR